MAIPLGAPIAVAADTVAPEVGQSLRYSHLSTVARDPWLNNSLSFCRFLCVEIALAKEVMTGAHSSNKLPARLDATSQSGRRRHGIICALVR